MSFRQVLSFIAVVFLFLYTGFIESTYFDGDRPFPTPKHELRAVWIATAHGLDFPVKEPAELKKLEFERRIRDWPTYPAVSSASAEEQKEELIDIIETSYKLGLNAIVFQVVPRGDAFYSSKRLPWSHLLSGTPGEDPGWDPLEVAVREAHKRGMELHAWYNVGRVGDEGQPLPDSEPFHVAQEHEDWIETVNNDWWLNPGIPEARTWMTGNVMEIVDNYNVDAIHFDFIRYPANGFESDPQTMEQYNKNEIPDLDDWRRDNLSEFLREVYPAVREAKPWVKVGSTPVGHYRQGDFPWSALWGYDTVFQDSRGWLEEGINDYIVPQIYWTVGESPDFEALAKDWAEDHRGRHIYIGKGAFVSEIRDEIITQIDITRTAGARGSVYFRYEHISPASGFPSILADRYNLHRSIVPSMEWMDSDIPPSPQNLTKNWRDQEVIELGWVMQDFATTEGDTLLRYAVYRINASVEPDPYHVISEGVNLAALTGTPAFEDRPPPSNDPYYYYVTALNRNNNESPPSEPIQTLTPLTPEPPIAEEYKLKLNYPNPFSRATIISFELVSEADIELTVYDIAGRKIATVVDERRPSGPHLVTFNTGNLASGVYMYRLIVTDPATGSRLFSAARPMTLIR